MKARRQLSQSREAHPAALVLGQESKELLHVTPIGFDRPGRHPALGAQIGEPMCDLSRDIGRGEG
jgi:hypothetical protein